MLKLPKQFTVGYSTKTKPTVDVEIDFNNSIVRWLVQSIDLVNSYTLDSTGNSDLTLSSSTLASIGKHGKELDFSVGPYYASSVGHELQEFTHECLLVVGSTASNSISGIAETPGSTTQDKSLCITSSGKFQARVYDGSVVEVLSTTTPSSGDLVHLAFTVSNGYLKFYVNGIEEGSAPASGSYTGYSSPELTLGFGYDGSLSNRYSDNAILLHRVYSKGLSPDNIKSLAENPYQILKPKLETLYFPAIAEAVTSSVYPLALPKQFVAGYSEHTKPTCAVDIDWSNPLTKHLKYCFIDDGAQNTTGQSVSKSNAIMDAGRIFFNGTIGNTIQVDKDFDWSGKSFTVITKFDYSSGGGAFPAIWGKGDTGADETMLRIASSDLQWYGAGTNAVSLSAYNNTSIACVYNHSGAVNADRYKMYSDGVNLNIVGTVAKSSYTTKRFEIGNADSGIATNRAFAGFIDYTLVFDTNLSEAEIKLLSENPYQILKPSIETLYFPAIQEAVQQLVYPLALPKQFAVGYSAHTKPTCPYEIDYTSDLIAKDTFLALFNGSNRTDGVSVSLIENGTITDKYYRTGLAKSLASDSYFRAEELNIPVFSPTTPFTVFAKVVRTGDGADFSGIFTPQLLSNDGGWLLVLDASNKIRFYLNDGSFKYAVSDSVVPLNEEVTISGSWDGGTGRLYINGKLQTSTASASSISNKVATVQSMAIGAYPYGHASLESFAGDILYVGITHKSWNDGQSSGFASNEFSILKPSIETLYFPGSAVSSGTITGTGAPQATTATTASSGTVTGNITGSASTSASTATASGTGLRLVSGTSSPQAETATTSASGSVGGNISGSATPQAETAIANATGLRIVTGSASPQAENATSSASGVVGNAVIGSGSPQAETATSTGAGLRLIQGSASPQAQTATSTATGTVAGVITGTGSPQAEIAGVTSTGVVLTTITGTASVQASTATAIGTDADNTTIHSGRVYTPETENRVYTVEAEDRKYNVA